MCRTVHDNFEYYLLQIQGKIMFCYEGDFRTWHELMLSKIYLFRRPKISHERARLLDSSSQTTTLQDHDFRSTHANSSLRFHFLQDFQEIQFVWLRRLHNGTEKWYNYREILKASLCFMLFANFVILHVILKLKLLVKSLFLNKQLC
jgi:hypothetical protein